MTGFACIVAADLNNGIGFENRLPWPSIPEDLRFFKETTTQTISPNKQNAVIMGRKTWESIPDKFRPLPDRINIVISNTLHLHPSRAIQASRFADAVIVAVNMANVENVYVMGGAQVYGDAFNHPLCKRIYLTRLDTVLEADAFLPSFIDKFKFEREIKSGSHKELNYKFEEWSRK